MCAPYREPQDERSARPHLSDEALVGDAMQLLPLRVIYILAHEFPCPQAHVTGQDTTQHVATPRDGGRRVGILEYLATRCGMLPPLPPL